MRDSVSLNFKGQINQDSYSRCIWGPVRRFSEFRPLSYKNRQITPSVTRQKERDHHDYSQSTYMLIRVSLYLRSRSES